MSTKTLQIEKLKVPKLRFVGFSDVWEEKKIVEVLKIGSGKDHKNLKNGNVPVFGTGGYMRSVDKALYSGESVFIGRKGTIDNPFYYNGDFWTVDTLFYTYDFKKIIPRFAYFIFSNINWKKYNEASGVPSLSKTTIEKIKIQIPSVDEQQKINNFLILTDEWIQNLKEQKENLELYKKGIMQKIFSHEIHFKDDSGNKYPEWEEKKIKDIFEITRGYVLAVKNMSEISNIEYQYPTYSSQTKNNGLIGYYREFLYEDAITWTTDGANAGDVNFRKGKFYCTNVCGVLISKEGHANKFTAELLNSVTKKYVSYVGNPKLMNNVMAQIKVKLPSVPEQQKIADFLTSFDKVIESKQQQISQAEQWKTGLMQGLFV